MGKKEKKKAAASQRYLVNPDEETFRNMGQ